MMASWRIPDLAAALKAVFFSRCQLRHPLHAGSDPATTEANKYKLRQFDLNIKLYSYTYCFFKN